MGQAFWWSPDGRLIYSLGEPELGPGPGSSEVFSNLWEIRVETRSGKPIGKPRRITDWAGFSFVSLHGSGDGKRLVFSQETGETHVYVGELEAGGTRLKHAPRRLTSEEHNEFAGAWTPDSKAVIFVSERSGKSDIFRQAVDQDLAEPVVTGTRANFDPRLSPDGSWILYVSTAKGEDLFTSAPVQLMRVPAAGGPSEVVLTACWSGYCCAPADGVLYAF